MCDDGAETRKLKILKDLVHRGRNAIVVEFEEQVVFPIDAEGGGVSANSSKIFQAQMKIAAGGQGEAAVEFFLKKSTDLAHLRIVERVVGTGVGRSDDVGDAVVDGLFGHGERLVKRPGAVVKARKDVAVKIDHVSIVVCVTRARHRKLADLAART